MSQVCQLSARLLRQKKKERKDKKEKKDNKEKKEKKDKKEKKQKKEKKNKKEKQDHDLSLTRLFPQIAGSYRGSYFSMILNDWVADPHNHQLVVMPLSPCLPSFVSLHDLHSGLLPS